jgi:hypothetical protein
MAGFLEWLDGRDVECVAMAVSGMGFFVLIWMWGYSVGSKRLDIVKSEILGIMLDKQSSINVKLRAISRVLWGKKEVVNE